MGKKEKKKKYGLIFIAIILIVIIVVCVIQINKDLKFENVQNEEEKHEEFVKVLDDGTKLNISTKLKETKKLGDLSIENIKYTYSNGISNISAEVINNSDKATELKDVKVTLLDKNNETISELEGLIAPLEPGAKTKLNLSVTLDLVNVYDFLIEEI